MTDYIDNVIRFGEVFKHFIVNGKKSYGFL